MNSLRRFISPIAAWGIVFLALLTASSFAEEVDPAKIATAYFECFRTKDVVVFKSLFKEGALRTIPAKIGGKTITKYWYQAYLVQNEIETYKILSVEDHQSFYAVHVQYQMKGLSEGSGTIYVNQYGKIKYAPILEHHHPGEEITGYISKLMGYGYRQRPSNEEDFIEEEREAIKELKRWSIPLFSYTENMPEQGKNEASQKILDWWTQHYNVFLDEEGIGLSGVDQEKVASDIGTLRHYHDQR